MSDKNKKLTPIIVICFFVILVAECFFWFWSKDNQASLVKTGADNGVEVTVVVAARQEVQLFLELSARVTAHKISEVRPQIDGIIKKIKFVEGSFVKKISSFTKLIQRFTKLPLIMRMQI